MKKTSKLTQPKTSKKLQLVKEKVRPMADDELSDVNGGEFPLTWCRTCSCWIC